jgi:hypothetical protein
MSSVGRCRFLKIGEDIDSDITKYVIISPSTMTLVLVGRSLLFDLVDFPVGSGTIVVDAPNNMSAEELQVALRGCEELLDMVLALFEGVEFDGSKMTDSWKDKSAVVGLTYQIADHIWNHRPESASGDSKWTWLR